jgi:phytoene dehydrogenase-like protein
MSASITILGAGVAGLATGIYAQMNGYQTRIYEMHSLPGGLCTSWRRKGFLVDGCIHWLCGSGPAMDMHHYWQELGVAGLEYVNHRVYMELELPDLTFRVYTNADEFESYLNTIGPEDEEVIHDFCQAIRDYAAYRGVFETPEAAQFIQKWSSMTMGQITARLKNPALCRAFSTVFWGEMPVFFVLLPLGFSHAQSAGYPLGGSLEFARAMEKRYLELGGEVHYDARAVKIVVENDRAVGVQFEDGSIGDASIVWEREGDIISTIDAHAAFYDLLEGRYLNDGIRAWFENIPVIVAPVMVTFGLNTPLAGAPTATNGLLLTPGEKVVCAGQEVGLLNVEVVTYDPAAAPEGKSVLRVNLPGNYAFWKDLRQDPAAYEAEKERLVKQVLAALEPRFPGIAGQVEMIDVATPVTFERYTGNWQGSSQGWVPVPQAYELQAKSAQEGNWPAARSLPGLSHFYTAGQWLEPFGGLPTGAITGSDLIRSLCERDGKEFHT